MTPRRRPRKPYDPAVVASFGGAGERPRIEVEQLPDDGAACEALVAERFAIGLGKLGHSVRVLDRIGDFPDARLEVDGLEHGLELVEVVNPRARARNVKRRWYSAELAQALHAIAVALTGVTLTIDDGVDRDQWPKQGSEEAHQVVQELATAVLSKAGELASLAPYGSAHIESDSGQLASVPGATMLMSCFHRSDDEPLIVRLAETGHESADEHASVMERAVRAKVAARYATTNRLWLLAWSSRGYCNDLLGRWRTWEAAQEGEHCFERIWGFDVAVGADAVPLELWPRVPDEERPDNPEANTFVLSLDLAAGMLGAPAPTGGSMTFAPQRFEGSSTENP